MSPKISSWDHLLGQFNISVSDIVLYILSNVCVQWFIPLIISSTRHHPFNMYLKNIRLKTLKYPFLN
jgi:hypothetical protein